MEAGLAEPVTSVRKRRGRHRHVDVTLGAACCGQARRGSGRGTVIIRVAVAHRQIVIRSWDSSPGKTVCANTSRTQSGTPRESWRPVRARRPASRVKDAGGRQLAQRGKQFCAPTDRRWRRDDESEGSVVTGAFRAEARPRASYRSAGRLPVSAASRRDRRPRHARDRTRPLA